MYKEPPIIDSVLANHWYPCLRSKDLGKKPVVVERLGVQLVLWRAGQDIRCFYDRCPHRGVSFARGCIVDDALTCPFHGFRFGKDGACIAMPCSGSNAKIPKRMRLSTGFVAKETCGLIWLWSGPEEPTTEPPWIEGVCKQTNWSTTAEITQIWDNNAVKLTESFFDLHHVYWVHRKTLPGVGPRMLACTISTENGHIISKGTLGYENKKKSADFVIQLKLPNLQYISLKGVQFLVCATPINDKESWLWARYEQHFLPVPMLGFWVAWLLAWGDFGILQAREDRPLLNSIRPNIPTPGSDCYVEADKGAAAFLRLWSQERKKFKAQQKNSLK